MNIFEKIDAALKNGDLDAALDLQTTVPPLDQQFSSVNRRISSALLQADRIDDAEKLARAANEHKPNDPEALALLGSVLQSLEKYTEATEAFGKVYHWTPTDPIATNNYADSLRRIGQIAEACVTEAEHHRLVAESIEKLPAWKEQSLDPGFTNDQTAIARNLYLDLLERTIANVIYQDSYIASGIVHPYEFELRDKGKDIPSQAHSMIGLMRLRQTRESACKIIEQGIPGDFFEAGVWRGGASILLRGVLAAYGDATRRVWVADSFEGLPPPDPRFAKDSATRFDFHTRPELSVGIENVKDNFRRYGLLDDRVVFLKGLFRDTLPTLPSDVQISLLRLDGDLYSSTTDALLNLYDKVATDGFIIVDDYGPVIDARRATLDFRLSRGVTDQMFAIDDDGIFWRKLNWSGPHSADSPWKKTS